MDNPSLKHTLVGNPHRDYRSTPEDIDRLLRHYVVRTRHWSRMVKVGKDWWFLHLAQLAGIVWRDLRLIRDCKRTWLCGRRRGIWRWLHTVLGKDRDTFDWYTLGSRNIPSLLHIRAYSKVESPRSPANKYKRRFHL